MLTIYAYGQMSQFIISVDIFFRRWGISSGGRYRNGSGDAWWWRCCDIRTRSNVTFVPRCARTTLYCTRDGICFVRWWIFTWRRLCCLIDQTIQATKTIHPKLIKPCSTIYDNLISDNGDCVYMLCICKMGLIKFNEISISYFTIRLHNWYMLLLCIAKTIM